MGHCPGIPAESKNGVGGLFKLRSWRLNAPCLRESAEGVFLAVKLQPRASRNQIAGLHGNELKISVTAPPVDSAANQALIEFLAERFDCSRSAVEIVRGQTSRHKTIFLRGINAADAARALGLNP